MNFHLLTPDYGEYLYRGPAATSSIEVRQQDTIRWMHFGDNAVQSVIDLNRPHVALLPYMQAMLCAFHLHGPVSHVLNLGAGGGAVERFLDAFDKDIHVVSVEANREVLRVARKFFDFTYPCHVQTAEEYLCQDSANYDLIFCDIYSTESDLLQAYEFDFLKRLSKRLSERGLAVLNYLPRSESAALSLLSELREIFNNLAILEIPDFRNLIIYCAQNALQIKENNQYLRGESHTDSHELLPDVALLKQLRVVPSRHHPL